MSLRILYVGSDLTLYKYLEASLEMRVVRCVGHSDAELLIKGIPYSVIVLDESAKELEHHIRKLRLHKKTPVIKAGPPEKTAEKSKNLLLRYETLFPLENVPGEISNIFQQQRLVP